MDFEPEVEICVLGWLKGWLHATQLCANTEHGGTEACNGKD
jgi:hypothetical protein